uniref:Uncharacterized protein n=1 Tax=Knipowitschia caucasica TaxID=637954 RepID=A0AAV2J506_KNICA
MLWSEETNTNRHQCEGGGGSIMLWSEETNTNRPQCEGGGGSIMLWSEETNTNRHQCEGGGAASCCGQRRPTLTGISVRGRGRQHHAVVRRDQH